MMDNLELRQQHLLHDFEEFEREFLPAYDPNKDINLKFDKNTTKRSWLEEMEQNFIHNQLIIRNFKTNHPISDQFPEITENPPPLIECLDVDSSNQTNDINHSRPLVPGSSSTLIVLHYTQTTYCDEIAYPPTASPSPAVLEELDYQAKDTNNTMITGSPSSNILTSNHTENMDLTNEENLVDLMNFNDFQFDLSVLDLINFDIPTSPQLEIDKTAYITKASSEFGEEFAKKVEENLRNLQAAMKRLSRCCNQGERVEEGVCCQGKCWKYMESRLRALQKIPRGRKRKGFELTPEQVALKKVRQKIRNRISAAAAYKKEKAYIAYLQAQVQELRAENKIRKNLIEFLESTSQVPSSENKLLGRTTSGTYRSETLRRSEH